MTIDEFMTDIAPKMRPGWVAMNYDSSWCWFSSKPTVVGCIWMSLDLSFSHLISFDIAPVDDWTQSLRKVGCNE